jgi:hypothetical protein
MLRLKTIVLSKISSIITKDTEGLTEPIKPNYFGIEVPPEKPFFMRTEAEEEMISWIMAIDDASATVEWKNEVKALAQLWVSSPVPNRKWDEVSSDHFADRERISPLTHKHARTSSHTHTTLFSFLFQAPSLL